MKLINIQGMTKCKIPEIEKLIESQTILCLTETQQKLDSLTWHNNYNRYVSMRNKGAKKGGGHENGRNKPSRYADYQRTV